MNPDLVWYLGCPVAVAGMAVVGVRAGRGRRSMPDGEVSEPNLVLAAAPDDGGDAQTAGARAPARGRLRAGARDVVRGLRGKVVTSVRRRVQAPGEMVGESGAHEAAASAGRAEPPGDRAAGVPEPVPDVVGVDQLVSVGEGSDHQVRGPRTISYGVGIVEVPQDEEEVEAGAADGLSWAAGVTSRESALARTLAQRDEEAARARQREAEAQALAAQHELERIAVAERARVQAQARLRSWFVRLDDQLDVPTTAQRCALIGTLGIRAAWAGKLLRTAFEQEQEPSVRARIVGALAAGGHFALSDPFEEAARRGGVERAAVWEALQPRRNEADWISALLASLLDDGAAA